MSSDFPQMQVVITGLAGDDLSTDQFRAVKHSTTADANSTFIGTTAQGERVHAVCLDEPTTGAQGRFCLFGPTKARFGAAVTVGAQVTPQADGDFETAASGDFIAGFALETGADGRISRIFFNPAGASVP